MNPTSVPGPAAAAPPPRRHLVARLWVIMATSFIDMLGFLIVLPLLPFYAQRMGASPAIIGALVGVFAFAQLVSAPLWGRLSDRYGRRPVILGGIAASMLAQLLFGLAGSITVLLLSRLAQGASGGIVGVIQAYVTDRTDAEEGAKALGWLTTATSAGVMIGPALGALAVRWSPQAPGLLAAGLCALNLLFAWRWLRDDAPAAPVTGAPELDALAEVPAPAPVSTPATPPVRQPIWQALLDVLRRPAAPVPSLVWIYTLGMMAFLSVNGVLALYLEAVFGFDERSIGGYYVFIGVVAVLMRGFALGPILDRLGTVRTLRLGALALGLGLLLLPLPRSIPGLALVAILLPAGTAMLFPAVTSLVSRLAAAHERGQTLGVQQTFGGIARGIGPIWAGLLFQHAGMATPFWVAAGIVLLALWFSRRVPPAT